MVEMVYKYASRLQNVPRCLLGLGVSGLETFWEHHFDHFPHSRLGGAGAVLRCVSRLSAPTPGPPSRGAAFAQLREFLKHDVKNVLRTEHGGRKISRMSVSGLRRPGFPWGGSACRTLVVPYGATANTTGSLGQDSGCPYCRRPELVCY